MANDVLTYRAVAPDISGRLSVPLDVVYQAVVDLVAVGHLPKSVGRRFCAIDADGILQLMICVVARHNGFTRKGSMKFAAQCSRRELLSPSNLALPVTVSLETAGLSVGITLPAGTGKFALDLERKSA